MRKFFYVIFGVFCITAAFFVYDIWNTVTNQSNTEYGHLLLRDRQGKIITDKGRSGGYSLPYSGSLDSELVQSIVKIEDARFYEHSGINLSAKIASLYQNLQAGGVVRGGSTITEQYIKNAYYSGQPRTILQKIRETIGALIIENRYSKDEILQKYLSNVYMGNGLYGIETIIRSESYDDNTLLEILTRLKFPNISESNKDIVTEYLTRVSEKIGKKPTNSQIFETKKRPQIDLFPILTKRVDTEVFRHCQGQSNTLKQWTKTIPNNLCTTSEVNLTLTIDSPLMERSQSIAEGILRSLEGKNVTNASIYVLDPRTDTLLAYIGSANPHEQIDMITRRRSVGSLLKPFIYLLALRSGADTEDYILDDKTIYETGIEGKYFVPENYNPKSYGPVRLREALGNSLNAATVRLTEAIGISTVYDGLRNFGLSLDHDAGYYGYGISLGTVETSIENIVQSYRSLIDDTNPNSWQIAQILSDPRNRARTFGISSILNTSIPISVKTGTSTDFRDNWAVSYGPDAIIGVWVGNTDGSSMGDVSGVTGAGPIWHQIAEYMIERGMIKSQKSKAPNPLHQTPICLDTNCFRKEMMYSKKIESPKSRPSEGIYFRSDFFGNVNSEEMEKWGIRN